MRHLFAVLIPRGGGVIVGVAGIGEIAKRGGSCLLIPRRVSWSTPDHVHPAVRPCGTARGKARGMATCTLLLGGYVVEVTGVGGCRELSAAVQHMREKHAGMATSRAV